MGGKHRRLATALGLSGLWLEVTPAGILDRSIPIHRGYYFLAWGDDAIMWQETERGPDGRIPPEARWLASYHCNDHSVWQGVFRAGQVFPHREALLRRVGFHQWKGPIHCLEAVPTPMPWEEGEHES